MVRDLFKDKAPKPRGDRVLSIFGPPVTRGPDELETNKEMLAALDEVDAMAATAGEVLKKIEDYADGLVVPIGESDNEVRGAHLRQGGDGKYITFAQFRFYVDQMKKDRADYAFNTDLEGHGFGDNRKIEKSRITRALENYSGIGAGTDTSWYEQVSGLGLQALLLWGMNELLGLFHSRDHSEVTSGKLPSGTEAGGLITQIVRAIIMMKFIHGMTEEAVEEYTQLGDADLGVGFDIGDAVKNAFNAGPPESRSYELFRAGLASNDYSLLTRHCAYWAGKHGVADGFETWFAYLSTREIHEKGLRESINGKLYRTGQLRGNSERASVLMKTANYGFSGIAEMQRILGGSMNPREACCFIRFVLAADIDFLQAIRTVIKMAIALLEAQAAAAFNWMVDLIMNPWNVIRSEVVRLVDGILEKVVEKVLDAFQADNEVWEIVRACTPVGELVKSVLDMIDYFKAWYKDLLRLLGDELEGWLNTSVKGWEIIWDIKKAKEQLRMLDRLIQEKQGMLQAGVPEGMVHGLIDEIRSLQRTYDLSVDLTDDIIRQLKILGSENMSRSDQQLIINSIDQKMAVMNPGYPGGFMFTDNPDPDRNITSEKWENIRKEFRGKMERLAVEQSDTGLNDVLSYVEDLVGEDSTAGEAVGGLNDITREATEWCRDLGDWDRLKGLFGLKSNEE